MTESDYDTFERAFKRVSGVFRLKFKAGELEELARTYYRVLETHPLEQVLQAGKQCLAQSKTFPKPADWLMVLVGERPKDAPADVRLMTQSETAQLRQAELRRYRDDACACYECECAAVSDRELRFVPDWMAAEDRPERAYDLTRERIATPGHWAHGQELARWYAARDAFMAMCRAVPPAVRRVIFETVGAGREPGQEG